CLQPDPQLAGLLAGPRDDDGAAEQRALLEPREIERRDFAHDDRRWRTHPELADRGQRSSDRVLIMSGPVAYRRDRRLRWTPAGHETRREIAEPPGTHEDHQRAAGPGQCLPVDVGTTLGR